MHTAAVLTILSLALTGATMASPLASVAKAKADNHILNMLAEANAMSSIADPELTTECFNYYLPIFDEISTNYSLQYKQCITTADEASNNLTAKAAANRSTFVNQTTAICSAFTACDSDNDTMDFFACYVTASTADVSSIYALSDSASNAAFALKAGLQQIKNTEDLCTSDAQHTYVMDTSTTYEELNACFVNGLPASTTTEALTTTEPLTTTAAPSTTTQAPQSTDASTTTVAPTTAAAANSSAADGTADAAAFPSASNGASSIL
ncbi:threonine-rich protein-like [Rhagoletis pomonella]|uniref:threonine-rich protein-like n=1 Tax=Rhagoletis pomonella TaxID=28610 RepID=UPI00177B862F|nr:threonine-rich protein-like [Rhagoletis pomonella]